MQIDPVITAIQIIKFATQNKKSLKESCKSFGKSENYVSDVKKRKERYLNNPKYASFLELHDKFMNEKFEKLKNDINDVINDSSSEKNENFEQNEQDITWDEKDDNASVVLKLAGVKINNLQEALEFSKVDLNIWEVERHIFNTWNTSARLDTGNGFQQVTNIQVKVWFRRKTKEVDQAWNDFLETINKISIFSKENYVEEDYKLDVDRKYLLELSLADLHIGKLAHEDEVGENYDTKIAVKRYKDSVSKLLNHVNHYASQIEEILLPVGNDLLQIDKLEGTTTAGTKVDTDSRWQQMFLKAKEVIIDNINHLMKIAPVKVLLISGNHDSQTIYYLGSVLEAYYRNTDRVTIDNSPTQRKYHNYGVNLIGFTHGNEEKHQDLGLIMATEKPELWAKTKCREIHLGHFHSRRTTKYVDIYEYQGFKIKVLPSLSGQDKWHNSKGYSSMKSAVAFLYDKEDGCIAEFSHNIL